MTDIEIVHLGLKMILDFLDSSGYEQRVKWEMTLRINRMLAGVISEPNPEAKILDYNIYKLGLTLLLKSNHNKDTKRRAEEIMPQYLSLKDGKDE